jgi:hypothetical protein
MRTWIFRVLPKLVRRTSRSASVCRPTLEQLEDRCVPSASMMQPMGMGMGMPPMNMPSMGMPTMNMPSMGANMMGTNTMNHGLSPNTMAALNQLFMDFNQTLRQVLSSQTLPQFFANEMQMRQIIAADLTHLVSSLRDM